MFAHRGILAASTIMNHSRDVATARYMKVAVRLRRIGQHASHLSTGGERRVHPATTDVRGVQLRDVNRDVPIVISLQGLVYS